MNYLKILFLITIIISGCSFGRDDLNLKTERGRLLLIQELEPQQLVNVEFTKSTDLEGLNGRVRKVSSQWYALSTVNKSQDSRGKDMGENTSYYDENGRLMKKVIIDHQNYSKYRGWSEWGPDTNIMTFQYDMDGKLIQSTDYNYHRYKATQRIYGENGKLLRKITSNRFGEPYLTEKNDFDNQGRIVRTTSTENNGRIDESIEITYDENQRTEVLLRYALSDDMVWEKHVSTYNGKNNLIGWIEYLELGTDWVFKGRSEPNLVKFMERRMKYTSDGKLKETHAFHYKNSETMNEVADEWITKKEYGENGQLSSEVETNPRSNRKIIQKYSKSGLLTEKIQISEIGKLISTEKYSYNDFGELQEEVRLDSDNQVVKAENFTYKYDFMGNVVERLRNVDGVAESVYKAEYEYYSPPENFDALFSEAQSHLEKGDLKKSVVLLTELINVSKPALVGLYYNRGVLKFMLSDFRGAISDFEMEIGYESKERYFFLGLSKLCLDEKEVGCSHLSKAGEMGHEEAFEMIARYCD